MQLSNLPTRGKLILEQNKNLAKGNHKGNRQWGSRGRGTHGASTVFLPSCGGFLDASRHVAFRTRPPKLPRVKFFPLKLVFATTAAALCFDMPASQAALYGQPRWGAVTDDGADNVNWDCEYETVDACRPAVLAGNRGFCALNPYSRPYPAPPRDIA